MIAARSGGSVAHWAVGRVERVGIAGGSFFIDCGDRLGLAQHAQHVAAGELGEVLVAPAAADQLGEQQWDSPGRRQARRACHANAVEVAADPDMVVAGDLGDMLDMVGDLRDGRPAGAGCAASQAFSAGFDVGLGWPV